MGTVFFKQGLALCRKQLLVYLWLISSLVFYASALAAQSLYQLDELAQLTQAEHEAINWQAIIANPSNQQQYFVMNEVGELYLFTDTLADQPALSIAHTQKRNNAKIKLTAITLHPNFHLRDQQGFGTFYTAHFESIKPHTDTHRIQEVSDDLTLTRDAVITQWQFNQFNRQQVDLTTQREVLRIAVPDDSFSIEQMSFNPAVKPWDDHFGLLYISLSSHEKWSQPLYSGVILRIDPHEFGLRSYTVPSNNPFIKDTAINDAIYVLGGQNIQRFFWPDNNSEQVLLAHQYNQKQLLSLTTGQDDWRIHASPQILYQGEQPLNDVVLYRGRELLDLRNKLLLLKRQDQQWLIETLSIADSSTRDKALPPTSLAWRFPTEQLAANSQPRFVVNYADELLVLDNQKKSLYQLTAEQSNNTEQPAGTSAVIESVADPELDSDNGYLLLLLSLVIAGGGYYFFKSDLFALIKARRKDYAEFEVSESKQQIGLFLRHQKRAELVLDLVDITCCEVRLNKQKLALISQQAEQGFNQDKEQTLRRAFNHEYVYKMQKGRVRQISLLLTDKQDKNYIICLYMRKGSHRMTKKSYTNAVDDLIDFCWLIGQHVNPAETADRQAKPVVSVYEEGHQMTDNTKSVDLSAGQQTAKEPVADPLPATKAVMLAEATQAEKINAINEVSQGESQATSKVKGKGATINSELVNALEKLVELKQQGYLTTEEFNLAKTKLLKNLFD